MEAVLKKTCILIICGGGGKRLWPESRIDTPKQFIKLLSDKTLFQETFKRIEGLVPNEKVFVQIVPGYEDEIRKQAPEIPKENIFVEPMSKNTALAMVYGSLMIKKKIPDAVVINLWSDHRIANARAFRQILALAAQAASGGDWLVTIGIKPTFPHTGLGYVKAVSQIKNNQDLDIYKGEFVEKPDLKRAKKFVASGQYYWNTGYYIWRLDAFVGAIKAVNPVLYRNLIEIDKAMVINDFAAIKKVFERAEDISIDYAVSEKVKNIAVLPANIGWSDVGDWKTVYDTLPKDEDANVVLKKGKTGEFVGIDTKNCLVRLSDRLIAMVGVEDLAVIETKDAILVCKKEKAQDVKKLVEFLKAKNKKEYL